MKCNHIVGTEQPRFSPEKPITHIEYLKRKGGWRGEVNYNYPLCGKEIWIWKTINDPRLGRVTVKRYVG